MKISANLHESLLKTILPPVRRPRSGRLCSSFEDQIKSLERAALNVKQEAEQSRKRKRVSEEQLRDLEDVQLKQCGGISSLPMTRIIVICFVYIGPWLSTLPLWLDGRFTVINCCLILCVWNPSLEILTYRKEFNR
ncbi:unnamed protein product [Citrullus colocynthis]|uniref:Uncharacterized protein n=1 Tax=Citrullus colocynthis TaxID=252529 RepID=A0ABP0YVB8_9ROSI